MKFTIDRPIKGSYSEEVTYQQSNDFSWMKEEGDIEKMEMWKLRYIETDEETINGYIDEDGICHRTQKQTIEVIEVNTLQELHDLTKDNEGKIVFGTNMRSIDGIDGWIDIYDDYRE